MKTANYTELRNNLKSYLDGVINDSEPLLVHRQGNESVVVISLDEYNAIKEAEYIMTSPAMVEIIRKGEEEIQNGNVVAQKEGESIADFLQRIACTE
jgi:antitoxin YefM